MIDLSKFGLMRKCFLLSDYKRYDSQKRSTFVFTDENLDVILASFYDRLIDAIETKKSFPVIRIADGEFQFLLGKNEFNLRKPWFELVKNILRQLQQLVLGHEFRAFSRTYSSGRYNTNDKKLGRQIYRNCLKHISHNGVVATYFIIKPDFYTEQYYLKFLKFIRLAGICLNKDNYIPFYFVYIILTNRRYLKVYDGRHVHLVTNFTEEKRAKIEQSLYGLGVKNVTWSKISREKSLYDDVVISKEMQASDIIFVGAGIGKPNIFNQLMHIRKPIVDAGYILEVWRDPTLALERDYCYQD